MYSYSKKEILSFLLDVLLWSSEKIGDFIYKIESLESSRKILNVAEFYEFWFS